MTIKQISLIQADTFISVFLGRRETVLRHRFSLGCYHNDKLAGVAIVGKAKAHTQNAVEILRLYANTKEIRSLLRAACVRAAKALGYRRLYLSRELSAARLSTR